MKLKIYFYFIFFICTNIFTYAQTSIEVYTNENTKFTLYLNGKEINTNPETNVSSNNLPSSISIKIVFEDNTIPNLIDKITSSVGRIRDDEVETKKVNGGLDERKVLTQKKVIAEKIICQIRKNKKGEFSLKVEGRDKSYEIIKSNAAPSSPASVLPVLDNSAFRSIFESVENATSNKEKVTSANAMVGNYQLNTAQVMDIVNLLGTFDQLEFAKNAYPYTTDKSNYNQVIEILKSISAKKELKQFLEDARNK